MQRSVLFGVTLLLLFCDVHSLFWGTAPPVTSVPSLLKNVTTLNGMVDVHMREFGPILRKYGLDPFSAPNVTQSFSLGTLDLTNITVSNISSIKRTGDVGVFDNNESRLITFNISIGVDELNIFSDYYAGNWLASSAGSLKGKLPGLNIAIGLTLDLADVHLALKSFALTTNYKDMQVEFYGSYVSGILNVVTSFIVDIFGNLILSYVEGPVKDEIVKLIDRVNVALTESLTNIG